MSSFDISKTVRSLEGSRITRHLSLDFKVQSESSPLYGFTGPALRDSVLSILVGNVEAARTVLIEAKRWCEHDLNTGKEVRFLGEFTSMFQRHLHSMIRWLLDGRHDQHSLDLWLVEAAKYFASKPSRINSTDLGLEAVSFLDSGAYQDLLKLAAPEGPESVKLSSTNEMTMAVSLAAQHLTSKFSQDKLDSTLKKFLDREVGKWLNNGHATRAAQWMKVVYWKNGTAGMTPEQTVRKCLDHVEIVT